MVLASPPSGENTTLLVYKWKEKEVSSVSTPATVFTLTSTSAKVTIKGSTGINTVPTATVFTEDATNGLWTYWTYTGGDWTLKTGHRSQRDYDVYFRKNGVDVPVNGDAASITSLTNGATYITVTTTQSVTSDEADAVVVSYQYQDVANPIPATYCVKDFNPKQNGRDYSTINCLGGVTKKRRQPQDLTEVSLSLYKTGSGLASLMLGQRMSTTENSLSVISTGGGNYIDNCAITVVVKDPDNQKNKIGFIMTNCGATALDSKGGADADYEESVSFKCDPEDYAEFEYTSA